MLMGFFDDLTTTVGALHGVDKSTAAIAGGLVDPEKLKRPSKPPRKALSKEEKEEGKRRYKELTSQYDKKTKTYTVGDKQIKSAFTPEQGGYYADSSLVDRDSEEPLYFDERVKFGITEYSAAQAASARKPFKRVNRTLSKQRKSIRRQRAIAYGRSGTILTDTLGGKREDKFKKKTLLG